jgi:hypothetical protein
MTAAVRKMIAVRTPRKFANVLSPESHKDCQSHLCLVCLQAEANAYPARLRRR